MIHNEFVNKIKEDKVFKQLLYAAEKKLEQEERLNKRNQAIRDRRDRLMDEQRKVDQEVQLLKKMYGI